MELISSLMTTAVFQLEAMTRSGDWLVFAFVFAAVLCAVIGAYILVRPASTASRRMANVSSTAPLGAAVSLRNDESKKTFDRVLVKLEKYLVQTNEQERSRLRERLMQAGYYSERAARIYFLTRILLAATLPVGFLLAAPTFFPEMKTQNLIFWAAGLAVAGLYLPWRYVESCVESRQRQITEGFPDALDLLVVCVEAGLGLDAALVRVSRELMGAHPVLSEQVGLVTLELRAGKSRSEALRNLATRTGVQEVNNFVTLIIQSEALGADLAHTLRVQADEMRISRMLRAEEMAHKLPVKLSVVLVLFILPAMFAVVLGPAIISIARDILPHLGT